MNLEASGIAKSYGRKNILKNASFTAHDGQCIGLLGANGSGKSTLLSILAGVQRCNKGSFFYEDKDLFHYPRQRAELIGYIPQGTPLLDELSAWDNLLLWYRRTELKMQLSSGLLRTLGICDFLKVPVSKMSGGMKKRLSIACAVASNPPILLLDEPLASLDIVCKQNILQYLKQHKEAGGIVVIAAHDVLELDLCDKWYILKHGELFPFKYDGNIETVAANL